MTEKIVGPIKIQQNNSTEIQDACDCAQKEHGLTDQERGFVYLVFHGLRSRAWVIEKHLTDATVYAKRYEYGIYVRVAGKTKGSPTGLYDYNTKYGSNIHTIQSRIHMPAEAQSLVRYLMRDIETVPTAKPELKYKVGAKLYHINEQGKLTTLEIVDKDEKKGYTVLVNGSTAPSYYEDKHIEINGYTTSANVALNEAYKSIDATLNNEIEKARQKADSAYDAVLETFKKLEEE